MRRILAPLAAFALVVGFTGCQKSEPAPPAPTTETTPEAAPPADSAATAVTAVEITGNDMLQFSVNAFTVKAGTEVTLTFKNVGTQPKESMGHNVVILKPGTDENAFAAEAMNAKSTDYVPANNAAVVKHTKLLGPGETDTITFTVPAEAGDYPYICSFPGHHATMKGVMKVVQ